MKAEEIISIAEKNNIHTIVCYKFDRFEIIKEENDINI